MVRTVRMAAVLLIGVSAGFLLGSEFARQRAPGGAESTYPPAEPVPLPPRTPAVFDDTGADGPPAFPVAEAGGDPSRALDALLTQEPIDGARTALDVGIDPLAVRLAMRRAALAEPEAALGLFAEFADVRTAVPAALGLFDGFGGDEAALDRVLARSPDRVATELIHRELLLALTDNDPQAALARALARPSHEAGFLVERVAGRWGAVAPMDALARAEAMASSPNHRRSIRYAVFAGWADQAPSAAIAWLVAQPEGSYPSSFWSTVLRSVSTLAQFDALPEHVRESAGTGAMQLVPRVAAADPEGALALARALPEGFRGNAMWALGAALAETDLNQALSYLGRVPEERLMMLQGIASAGLDPSDLSGLLSSLDERERGAVLHAAASQLTTDAERDAFVPLIAGEVPALRDAAWQGMVASLASEESPAALMQWVAEHPGMPDAAWLQLKWKLGSLDAAAQQAFVDLAPASVERELRTHLAELRIQTDPEAAAEELLSAGGAVEPQVAWQLASNLAGRDPAAARRFVDALAPGPARRQAYGALTSALAGRGPGEAERWARSLSGEDRAAALGAIVLDLAEQDPARARALALAEPAGSGRDELIARYAAMRTTNGGSATEAELFAAMSTDAHRAALATIVLAQESDPTRRRAVLVRAVRDERAREIVEAQLDVLSNW